MPDSDFAAGLQRPSRGCGVQGCLFGAVALFVLILVGVLIIAVFRFRVPPQGIPQPPVSLSAEAVGPLWSLLDIHSRAALPAAHERGISRRPGMDDGRAKTRRATGGRAHG